MPISASAAYRKDLAGKADRISIDDGAWLEVACVIQHATLMQGDERAELVRQAVTLASELLGQEHLDAAVAAQGLDIDRSHAESILLLAEDMQEAGALNLASVLLDALLVAEPSSSLVSRGRVIAKRARVAWKLGLIDEAEDRYREVRSLGKQIKSAELLARADIGFAALAQMRGNFPDMKRYSERAARIADKAGLRVLGRQAHLALLIVAAKKEQFGEALAHGWSAFVASNGNPVAEGEILLNLGQVLFDSGHVMAARAAFADVVARELPAHLVLPALGGLALASALTHAESWTDWASNEVGGLQNSAVPRYALASALWECALALKKIGRLEPAARFRQNAFQLSKNHGFHEILFRIESDVEQDAAQRAASRLTKPAAGVARQIVDMAPKRLPEHVRLAAALVHA